MKFITNLRESRQTHRVAFPKMLSKRGAHLLHALRLRGRRIPAVVQDEDVWATGAVTLWKNCFSWMRGKTPVKTCCASHGPAGPPAGWILGVWGKAEDRQWVRTVGGIRVGHQHEHVEGPGKTCQSSCPVLWWTPMPGLGGDRGKPSSDPSYSSCSEQTAEAAGKGRES